MPISPDRRAPIFQSPGPALTAQEQRTREQLFDALDRNHDGVLSKEEFLAAIQRLQGSPPAPHALGPAVLPSHWRLS